MVQLPFSFQFSKSGAFDLQKLLITSVETNLFIPRPRLMGTRLENICKEFSRIKLKLIQKFAAEDSRSSTCLQNTLSFMFNDEQHNPVHKMLKRILTRTGMMTVELCNIIVICAISKSYWVVIDWLKLW